MDTDVDYIDNNYAWQRRILTVFKYCKTSACFPHAAAIGIEYNPAFHRRDRIEVELLTNGAVLDVADFVNSVTKLASFHLLDILDFNFDLGLDADGPLYPAYASKIYVLAKSFKDQFKTRPLQLHAKLQEVFALPDVILENADLFAQKPELEFPLDLQLNDERKADPLLVNKAAGRSLQVSMDCYPLCRKAGVAFVLRPSNAPAPKLGAELLTGGMVLEMLDFAQILSGSHFQMLKEVISHNFGDVYEPSYLSGQLKALAEQKEIQPTKELRESFCQEPFEFMLRKVRKAEKRPADPDNDVEVASEKRRSEEAPSNAGSVSPDEETSSTSYMCPVEFEPDVQTNAGPENEEEEEDVFVDVECDASLSKTVETDVTSKKTQRPHYFGFQFKRKRKHGPVVPIPEIFCQDTLPTQQKTVKQREWTRRSNRIIEIFNKGIQDLFCRCREIGLDFNVGSGRKQNLDMKLLTNHTLYEVNRFSVHLSKSVSVFMMDVMENNFNLCFQDEAHERNFMSYLLGKEKHLCNQAHNRSVMSSRILFPEGYNVVDLTRESDGAGRSSDASDEFPYCKDIGLNLWSVVARPPDRKLDLTTVTHGALLEIITFARRLASNPRDLLGDVLEHNFDVDLQDPATDDSRGLSRWFALNKPALKRQFSALRANVWLIEEVGLKRFCSPSPQLGSETAAPAPAPKAQKCPYEICEEIGLELNVSQKSASKQKLDLRVLTRAALFEVHSFVKTRCNRYVPALYEILDYNFDLSSQRHRKVELAWSIAAQVLAMVRKGRRKGPYMRQVFELPFETRAEDVCKEEPEQRDVDETEPGGDDVVFVQKLIPVDIDVEIE